MKVIELVLPSSGKKVKMREATGLDEWAASRKFLDKDENEKRMEPFELIARCVEIDGKRLSGYEEILKLSTKDIEFLMLAFNKLNTLTQEEVRRLDDFFQNAGEEL